MSIPTLKTERLILRPWEERDLKPFSHINCDPQVMEFYPHLLNYDESAALMHKMIADFSLRGYGFWAVEKQISSTFIGYIGLNYWDLQMPFSPCIDIGWRLSSKEWGHGYAIEGATAALDFGFQIIQLEEIVAMATSGNIRSHRVMQKLGMKSDPQENFEHPKVPKGDPLSLRLLYRLSKQEWTLLRQC